METPLPPIRIGRKPRPSSSFDSICSWGQNLRTPSGEGRRISMDSITPPLKESYLPPTSPSRRVSFETDLNCRPIDSFRQPTLSSLKKRRPVAIIKACTENLMNEPQAESKSVVESSRILERLRSLQTRSPLLEQKKQELEEVISLKVIAVSKYDLLEASRDSSNCVHDLASLYGQISHKLDLSENPKSDIDAKLGEVKSFMTSIKTCFFRVSLLDLKIESWKETIDNCGKLLNLANARSQTTGVEDLLKTTSQNVDSSIKSCIIWASKITNANTEIMSNYFEYLPLEIVSKICCENEAIDSMVKKYNMVADVSPIANIPVLVAQKNARKAANSFSNMVFQVNSEERKLDLDTFFGGTMADNQRDLLKLMFALNDEKSLYSPARAPVKTAQSPNRKKSQETRKNANFYRETDKIYWSNFWREFKEELVKETFVEKSEFLKSEGIDFSEISFGFTVLESIKSFVVEGLGSGFTEEAINALDSVYCKLHRTLSDKKWSISHRSALSSMDAFKSNNECPDNSNELLESNDTSTKVGHYTIKSLESVVQFIINCEKGTELTKQTSYNLSLTLNTFLNWFNCDEISTWDPKVAFSLVFGDFTKMVDSLKQVRSFEEVEKYIQELQEVQGKTKNKIKELHTIEWTGKTRKLFPRREYRMKSCPSHVHLWSDSLIKNSVIPTIDMVRKFSDNPPSNLQFVDIFFKAIISIVFDSDHRVKFSKSGATCFMKEIIFLIQFFESFLGQEIDLESVHLLKNFAYFIHQKSNKKKSGNQVSPLIHPSAHVKREFNQRDHFVNDCTCFSLPFM